MENASALSTPEKRVKLYILSNTLKNKYVGLDSSIDEIIELIKPWYIYPEFQLRPTIINLWGMTGVGKTALVNEIANFIGNEDNYYHFDMGNSEEANQSLKTFFTQIFKSEAAPPFILALDEFQYARTKDNKGQDFNNFYSRGIWELFDTGKLSANFDPKHIEELESLLKELKYFRKNGVKVENGYVTARQEFFKSYMDDAHPIWIDGWKQIKCNNDFIVGNDSTPYTGDPVRYVPQLFLSRIYDLAHDWFEHMLEVYAKMFTMNDSETIEFLERVIQHAKGRKIVDCSKALIFVMGNLDEAYNFAGHISSDISADEFHKRSLKINIHDVKEALSVRFRNEHIARLGNNHIIYPALSSESYYEIIKNKLAELAKPFEEMHNLKIIFHFSVVQLIYNEGVYPVQGTRPVFSTIQKIVEPAFTSIPLLIFPRNKRAYHIFIDVVESLLILNLTSRRGLPIRAIEIPLKLNLVKLKEPKNDQLQAVVAVHEAGHALLGILLTGKVPEKLMAHTSNEDTPGMTVFESPEREVNSREVLLKMATILLGGLVAENLIYGKEHTSDGSNSDMRRATRIIIKLINHSGMGNQRYFVQSMTNHHNDSILDHDASVNAEAKELVEQCAQKAEQLLQENIAILKILARELFQKSVLVKQEITQLLADYWIPIEELNKINPPLDYIEILMGEKVVYPIVDQELLKNIHLSSGR